MEAITGRLILKSGRGKPVRKRHPWVFSGAVESVAGAPAAGDLVEIADSNGRFLALGYYNPTSQIHAHILSWDAHTPIDDAFWSQRIQRALTTRTLLGLEPDTTAYRLINAEADGLPGLIVDKYADFLVLQCLTKGIEQRKQMLVDLLKQSLGPQGIYERSDLNVRAKEGLQEKTGSLQGNLPPNPIVILENGHHFAVDVYAGHKTGFYLDQRENRQIVSRPIFVTEKEVLNVFAYTGGFGVYAAANGARSVVQVDTSVPALELAESNMQRNGFERPSDEYIAGDAFEVLRYFRDQGRRFDVVILDPPKFVHSQRDLSRASRGYKDLNWLALRLLRRGGVLATFSCSGLVSAQLFQQILFGAALDARRDVQIMQTLGQSADHPILLTFPESAYLKGLLCRVW